MDSVMKKKEYFSPCLIIMDISENDIITNSGYDEDFELGGVPLAGDE